jgi:hypothetical protein
MFFRLVFSRTSAASSSRESPSFAGSGFDLIFLAVRCAALCIIDIFLRFSTALAASLAFLETGGRPRGGGAPRQ